MQINFSKDAFIETAKDTLPHVACLAVACAGATLLTGGGVVVATSLLIRLALQGAMISAIGSTIAGCTIGSMENKGEKA